jgi:predicted PolB exonuclease-like 3'-5' exonuclease
MNIHALYPNSVLVFDFETIPDCEGLRRLYINERPEVQDWDDTKLAEMAFDEREAQTGQRFLPAHLQKIVAISCVFRDQHQLKVKSLGEPEDDESKIISLFIKTIEKYTPQLVSWNGSGFDMPVLLQRALINGLEAQRLLEWGETDKDFKYQNYLNRYHTRHLDLMDFLSLYQRGTRAPLDDIAKLCGLPGKMGMDGSQVWPAYQAGKIEEIRHYCETDVMNTYGVFVFFQHLKGQISTEQMYAELSLIYQTTSTSSQTHWQQYTAGFSSPLLEKIGLNKLS